MTRDTLADDDEKPKEPKASSEGIEVKRADFAMVGMWVVGM